MHKWTLVSAVLALGVFSAGPVLAQTCEQATATYEAAVDDYLGAKFALDRATQLLASARYASIVGKMKINIALQETDVARALPGYIASLGPTYAAIDSIDAACSTDVLATQHRLPAQFKQRIDDDLASLLQGGVDKLANDQMADTKSMFDSTNKK